MSLSRTSSWSFPEPEKTTAWERAKDTAPAFQLRDTEAEKAKKRTELIKARMSPAGKLGLPPLLEEARWRWGIPDGAFAARAVFDRIHIFPIDLFDDSEKIPGTNLFRPNISRLKDEQGGHRGVLISMGLEAADHCVSHGIELGHIVRTIRNAPHSQECERLEEFSVFYLVMRDGDLTGDETLEEQIRQGDVRIVDDGGEHSYCHNLDGRKKKSALINDNW